MLPPHDRLRSRQEFSRTVRTGRRGGRRRLVVHLAQRPAPDPATSGAGALARPGPRAGLVVSAAVGGAVTRKAVSRRLRHLLVPVLASLPDGTDVVVRALPAAAGSSSADLAEDLAGALRSARRAAAGRA